MRIEKRVRRILKQQRRDEYKIVITFWADDPAVGEDFVNRVVNFATGLPTGAGTNGPEIDTSYFEKRMAKISSVNKTWTGRLQDQYESFEEFEAYDRIYGLSERLGYTSAEEAWDENPMVTGSTDPADYRRVGKMTEDEIYGEQTGTLIHPCWDEEGTKEYPPGTEVVFEGSIEELMRQYMGGLIEDVRLPDGSYRRLEPDAVSWHALGI